ncbi:MAG TPA: DUF2905 domain-containing protein [Candidatus Omnitrophica bacterium]|nr:DUF2905 domain-containing protein [Candidatus Omnitrophota bacterium]
MIAKTLIIVGFVLIAAGILWHFGLLKWVGKLPGDIRIERESFSFYFPLATCLLISLFAGLAVQLSRFLFK